MDIGSILVNQQFAVPVTLYDTEKLQADLSAGVANVMAGVGGAHILDIDTGQGFALFRHTAAVYDAPAGTGYTGDLRCALGITSNGLMAGFNRKSDGKWVNSLVIDATTGSATFTGAINAESGNFTGTVKAGSIITGSVTIAGVSGNTTLDDIIAASGNYTTADLEADLAAGIGKIVAGTGSDYRLTVDPANGFIVAGRNGSVFKGTATPGTVRPALGISANGIAMGYNRSSDGLWVDGVAIDASGNASFSGAINATSGNFTGTVKAGSIITSSVTVDGTTLETIKANAALGVTAIQPAAIAGMLTASSSYILDGTISVTNAGDGIKTGTIAWDANGTVNGGSGVAITAKGIVGASGGTPTFTLNGTTGAATFKGDITGATGAFSGTVSAANITAGTLTAAVSINSSGSVNATGVYGSAVGNAAIVGAPSTTSNIGVAGISTSGTGVYGQSSSGNGVYGNATSTSGAGVYGFGYSTTGIALFAGGSGRIALGGTGVQIRGTGGVIRATDSYTTDAYLLMISAYGAGSGTTATLGPKLGTNAAMAGWMTCKVGSATVYIPYWT